MLINRFYSRKRTFYEILEVSHDCNLKEIKSQYYKLCKLAHPDTKFKRAKSDRDLPNFQEITAAYETLKDSKKRREYDRSLALIRYEAPKVDLTDFQFKESYPDYRSTERAMKFWSKMACEKAKKDQQKESEIDEAMRQRKEERRIFRDRALVLGAIIIGCWVSNFWSPY